MTRLSPPGASQLLGSRHAERDRSRLDPLRGALHAPCIYDSGRGVRAGYGRVFVPEDATIAPMGSRHAFCRIRARDVSFREQGIQIIP
jgi:hypothetical protein